MKSGGAEPLKSARLPRGLVIEAPSYRVGESELEIWKAHAVRSELFDSASWHLAIERHARLRGPCLHVAGGCAKLSIQIDLLNQARWR